MTYLTDATPTTQIAFGFSRRLTLWLPKFGICRAIFKMTCTVALTFEMAYLAPFSASQRQPSIGGDEELEGRDPNW